MMLKKKCGENALISGRFNRESNLKILKRLEREYREKQEHVDDLANTFRKKKGKPKKVYF